MSKKDYIEKKCKCLKCTTGNPYSCARGDNCCDKHRWRLGQKLDGTQREQLKEWNEEQDQLERARQIIERNRDTLKRLAEDERLES